MLGTANLKAQVEEGAAARAAGKESWENPYSFTTETPQAYAWEEGFKRGVSK